MGKRKAESEPSKTQQDTDGSISIAAAATDYTKDRQIPWDLIVPYLYLFEFLEFRLVSKEINDYLATRLSKEDCVRWMAQELRIRDIFAFWHQDDWQDASSDDEHYLIRCFPEEVNPWDFLVRFLKVMTHMPEQVLVRFNARYGRHCVPILKDRKLSSIPRCTRRACTTCALRIPSYPARPDDAAEEDDDDSVLSAYDIDERFVIRRRGTNTYLDLKRYYPKCVPNMDPTLCCPVCQVNDRRTLILGEIVYQTCGASDPLLERWEIAPWDWSDYSGFDFLREFTPAQDDHPFEHFRQLFIPGAGQTVDDFDHESRSAITLYCDACKKFGLIAPACQCLGEDSRRPCVVGYFTNPYDAAVLVRGNFFCEVCQNRRRTNVAHYFGLDAEY